MRNKWGVEIKPGYYAWARSSRGGVIEGIVRTVERTGDFARAYGPRVIFDSGQSVGVDDVSQVLAPMRLTKGGIVKANPTPRIKRSTQKSQRARVTAKGTFTKKPSARLINRRNATRDEPMPGVWANPLVRVKVNSPMPRTSDPARLKKRRKTTQKSPQGFYANPVSDFSFWVKLKLSKGFRVLARFQTLRDAEEYARAVHAQRPNSTIVVEKT